MTTEVMKCGHPVSDLVQPLCNERPELRRGEALSMYHCPDCGEMLVVGVQHPRVCTTCYQNYYGHRYGETVRAAASQIVRQQIREKEKKEPLAYFVPAWLDACASYRMFMPHLHLPHSRFLFHPVRTPVEELSEADIVVVQRQCSQGNLLAMKQMRDMGLKIIYDLDDDLWAIPASSPAKRIFEPVKEGFGRCMEFCDAITVSTEGLKTAVKSSVPIASKKPIVVIPNGIDFDLLHPAPLKKSPGRVTVGWGGSNTHAGDVGAAWRALPKLLNDLPQLYMEFVGMDPPEQIANHPRVKTREFCPIGEFANRFASWGWDIVLAPLDDVRFNRSKSAIKVLEAAAINAVCLMSPVGPYADFCSLNKDLKWLLCGTSADWGRKIFDLVSDEEHRLKMARAIRRTAEEHFEQNKLMDKWRSVFDLVMQ